MPEVTDHAHHPVTHGRTTVDGGERFSAADRPGRGVA